MLKNGYEALIAMDGDGQHSPSDIAAFVACYQNTNADIVSGNRMHNPKGMPLVRLATNRLMSWLISLICRQHIPDTQCGFRLIKTKVLQAIKLESSDFEIETEVLIKASKKGFKIASVGIQTIYRDEVSKIQPVRDTFVLLPIYGGNYCEKMTENFLFKAVFISLAAHTAILCAAYLSRINDPHYKAIRQNRVEISYKPVHKRACRYPGISHQAGPASGLEQ